MSTATTVAPVATEAAPVAIAPVAAPIDPFSTEAVPNNKLAAHYWAEGYELLDGFRTRNEADAIDKAKELRKSGTHQTAKLTLLAGWFGVVIREAPATEAKHATVAKPILPVEVAGHKFTSCKEARAFARLILEAARQAEYDFDVAAAQAAKAGQ